MWHHGFQKHIDNLRTNYKGVYVLQDDALPALAAMGGEPAEVERARLIAQFPAGLIRGALACAGISAEVKAEVTTVPTVKFNLNLNQGPPA